MTLPIPRNYAPMEAQPAQILPAGPQIQYEPKWDGFRCLAFREGSRVNLESKSGKPVTPKLVIEVQFDHFTGGCFRHGTKFLRWRPDKSPRSCTMEQVRRESDAALRLL